MNTQRPDTTADDGRAAPLDTPAAGAALPPRRDHQNWAANVQRLTVEKRDGVRGTNVSGRRLTGPIQGFGKMWQKTYVTSLGRDVTPEHAISEWREHFGDFWPKGNRFAGGLGRSEARRRGAHRHGARAGGSPALDRCHGAVFR